MDDASSEYGPGFVFPEQDEKEVLGRCPRCGGDVTEFPSGFSCSGHENGCGFVIWKKSKLKMLSKTTFTAKDVRAFLLGQSVRKTTLLKKERYEVHGFPCYAGRPEQSIRTEFHVWGGAGQMTYKTHLVGGAVAAMLLTLAASEQELGLKPFTTPEFFEC